MKILISDKLAPEGIAVLQAVEEFDVECKFGIKPEELRTIIKDYDALIVRSGTNVAAEIIEVADKLKFIGRAGVGLDNVDLNAATKKGIVAMNTPSGNTTATAEHTMSLILALSRNIPQAYVSLKKGLWERSKFRGVELHGKTLGIIGMGRIGSTVAGFAKSFGMKVLGFDPFLSEEIAAKMGIDLIEFDQLLKDADFITIHIPKNAETKKLISGREFSLMKKGARLINCARGGIVDEQALKRALLEGKIAGCALDVFDLEPPEKDNPLLQLDNCIVTPHLGAATSEAQINVAIEIAETVRDALLGRGIKNAANFPSVSSESYEILKPYIDLSERMGQFAGQLFSGRINKMRITFAGEMIQYQTAPLTMTLAFGILQPVLGETINRVNALEIARERGIHVEEIHSSKEEEFVNLVKVEIVTDKEPFSVWGTLTSNSQPRIVKVNSVYVEAVPDGHIIFINNNDKPGIVGAVGTILADDGINIAGITFGRETPGGLAISVVNVDSPVCEETIQRIRETKDVLYVKVLKI